MKEQNEDLKRERLKKLLLVLPALILPFLCLAFWALGGGKGDQYGLTTNAKGINTQLPDAKFGNDKPQDKLSLYNQAQRDSAALRNQGLGGGMNGLEADSAGAVRGVGGGHGVVDNSGTDANEARMAQKLEQLRREINRAPEPAPVRAGSPGGGSVSDARSVSKSAETERLEKLMREMKEKDKGSAKEDPEMAQLSQMLDKIQAIQNPELAKRNLPEVNVVEKKDTLFKAIPALIDGNQKVLQGGVVRLRLLDTLSLKGVRFPKGQALSGNCTIVNQRLLLSIKNIRVGNSIVPVDLNVYALDGIMGINAPTAELAESAGSSSESAMQSMQFLPMDQSLSTQAASAGIVTAKSLFSKKVKKVKVKLQGNTKVLLRNNQPDKL